MMMKLWHLKERACESLKGAKSLLVSSLISILGSAALRSTMGEEESEIMQSREDITEENVFACKTLNIYIRNRLKYRYLMFDLIHLHSTQKGECYKCPRLAAVAADAADGKCSKR